MDKSEYVGNFGFHGSKTHAIKKRDPYGESLCGGSIVMGSTTHISEADSSKVDCKTCRRLMEHYGWPVEDLQADKIIPPMHVGNYQDSPFKKVHAVKKDPARGIVYTFCGQGYANLELNMGPVVANGVNCLSCRDKMIRHKIIERVHVPLKSLLYGEGGPISNDPFEQKPDFFLVTDGSGRIRRHDSMEDMEAWVNRLCPIGAGCVKDVKVIGVKKVSTYKIKHAVEKVD